MASKLDISNAIIRGYAYAVHLTNELADEQDKGCVDCYDTSAIECILWLTGALQDKIDRDILDIGTDSLYEQLVEATSPYIGDVVIDENASIPYVQIIVQGESNVEWGNISGDIANQTDLIALLAKKADIPDGLVSGGEIDISDFSNGNISVSAATWRLTIGSEQSEYETIFTTMFTGIGLSSSGSQRYVAFFGTGLNTIIKIEGTESSAAVLPNTPNDTVLLGYVLITDIAAENPVIDLSEYVKYSDVSENPLPEKIVERDSSGFIKINTPYNTNFLSVAKILTHNNDGTISYINLSDLGIITFSDFTEEDLISDGFGGFYLPFTLVPGQILVRMLIDYGSIKTMPVPEYDFTVLAIPNFPNNDPQNIRVFYTV